MFHAVNYLPLQCFELGRTFMHILRSYTATVLSFITIGLSVKEEFRSKDFWTDKTDGRIKASLNQSRRQLKRPFSTSLFRWSYYQSFTASNCTFRHPNTVTRLDHELSRLSTRTVNPLFFDSSLKYINKPLQ